MRLSQLTRLYKLGNLKVYPPSADSSFPGTEILRSLTRTAQQQQTVTLSLRNLQTRTELHPALAGCRPLSSSCRCVGLLPGSAFSGGRLSRLWAVRTLATGPVVPSETPASVHKVVRFLVLAMLALVGMRILPTMGQQSVSQALGLLDAPDPGWQRRGADRVAGLAQSEANLEKLICQGAHHKLTELLESTDSAGVTVAALKAAEVLCEHEDGREALVRAGLLEVLNMRLQDARWLDDSQVQTVATALSVTLQVQQDHVD